VTIQGVDQIKLDVLKRAATVAISDEMIQCVDQEVVFDFMREMWVQRVSWKVAAQRSENVLFVPATWWQHLKQRIYGLGGRNEWMTKKWPIRYKTYRAINVLPAIHLPEKHLNASYDEWVQEAFAWREQ